MAVYPINEGFLQPVPPEQPGTLRIIDKSESLSELTESEDEPAPHCEGEYFADAEEVIKAIDTAYKRNNNFQIKLIKFASRKILEIMGGKYDGKLMPDDVVNEAFYRIINLNRKWYIHKIPKIENLVLMVIVSLIRIESEKILDIENRLYDEREEPIRKTARPKKSNRRRMVPLYFKDKEGRQSENMIIDNEIYKQNNKDKYEDEFDYEQLDENELISQLEKELEEDETAFFVLQEILDGNKSNIDIAAKLGIEVKEVENARKRIKRKAIRQTAK